MQYAKVERTLAKRRISFETGRIAKQAAGSVIARYGDSMVLSAVCSADGRPGLDFFPLTVEYREKTYAAGKFPGGFIKREGRPKDKEILTMRLIDRPVRPLWPDGYKNEVQITNTVLSVDKENDPDVVAMNASFAALYVSDLPFKGPIAAMRVGRLEGKLVAFPTVQEVDEGDLDLIMVVSRDALVMVEGRSAEITESDFLAALDFGTKAAHKILDLMEELREKAGAPPRSEPKAKVEDVPAAYTKAKKSYAKSMREALLVQGKHERYAAIDALKEQMVAEFVGDDLDLVEAEALKKWISRAHKELTSEQIRHLIVKDKKRIDNRGPTDIRAISVETGLLPRTHGSALFTRGETQALVIVTLGTPRDQQIVDGLMEEYSKRFDLQYNFPPYSVGECRPLRGVSRREIGHGYLAERAVAPIIPSTDKFPYTIRLVSEVTESNGSSSMATVCGSTLALMDAGVPIRQPVAGIAMGLIQEGKDVVILSDILGTEDHVGDMDFKVAGTGRGITSVQMDIKIGGLSRELMEAALEQARQGRIHILREMMKAMRAPREEISQFAPRLLQIRIPVEKIGLVIGPGGKMIKKIQEDTGAGVEIDDDGTVVVSSESAEAAMAARRMIEQLTAEVEVGQIYEGRVVSIKDFGAFVEVLPGQEGLCHVSELDEGRVREVTDVVSVGDVIPVKVILRDEQGRLKLSRRAALEQLGGGAPAPKEDDAFEDDDPDEDLGDVMALEASQAEGSRGPRRDDGGRGRERDDRGPRGEFRGPRGPRDSGDRPRDDRPRGPRDDRPRGDRPRGDRPRGDRPRDDRPRDDRPRDDRPRDDRPRDDRPRDDRPRDDRPRDDRPRDDRPRDDRPRDDRPRDDRPRDDRPRGGRDRGGRDDRPRRDDRGDRRPDDSRRGPPSGHRGPRR